MHMECHKLLQKNRAARTYERVATSHGHWVWAGADDLAWASKTWRVQLGGLRGKISLWEGGLFGRLMRSPEAIAALGPGAEGVGGGLEEVRHVPHRRYGQMVAPCRAHVS